MSVLPSVENCCEVLKSYVSYIIQEKSHSNTQIICICQFHNWKVQGRCPKEFGFSCVANAYMTLYWNEFPLYLKKKIASITVLDMCSLLIHVYSQAFFSLCCDLKVEGGEVWGFKSLMGLHWLSASLYQTSNKSSPPHTVHLTSYPRYYTILLVSLNPLNLWKWPLYKEFIQF